MIPQLPFGDDDFVHIQTHADFLYVDKTSRIAELFAPGRSRHLFLARPRRFGKTLLLSTVEALFQGRRDLFRDTWIGQEGHWDWEGRTHPVLRLDLGLRGVHDAARLEAKLGDLVYHQARRRQIPLPPDKDPDWTLLLLVEEMAEAAGRKVAVLVDEYDTAITENLDRPKALPPILDVLRAFYGTLKSSSPYIEFTLMTGITRLARAGLFSGANHLTDLSHRPAVNGLLGFTDTELQAPRVAALVAQGARHLHCAPEELYTALEREYNGYRFAAGQESVYNPYTLAGCLEELADPDAARYWSLDRMPRCWIDTGMPALLLRALQGHAPAEPDDPDLSDPRELERTPFDVVRPRMAALMYQTGYLTLGPDPEAELVFPNREVQEAFQKDLTPWWKAQHRAWRDDWIGPTAGLRRAGLTDAWERGDDDGSLHWLNSVLAARGRPLPGLPESARQMVDYETYWQNLLTVLCDALGLPTFVEVPAGSGRADLAVEWERGLCLVELKIGDGPEAGLRQAFRRNYPALFQGRDRPVVVMGLQIDRKTHRLTSCRLHRLGQFHPQTERWDHEPFTRSLAELQGWSDADRVAYVAKTPLRSESGRPPPPRESGHQIG